MEPSGMRIGLVAYGLERYPTGIGRYTLELTKAISASHASVDLFLFGGSKCPSGVSELNVKWVRLPGSTSLPGMLTLGSLQLLTAAKRLKLDVVHDPTGISPFVTSGTSFKKVVTIHDAFPFIVPESSSGLERFLFRVWLPWSLRHVDAMITVSLASRNDLENRVGLSRERLHVVYEGVSSQFEPPDAESCARARAKYGLPEEYLLNVCTNDHRKNLPTLLRAYHRLRLQADVPQLVVVANRGRFRADTARLLRETGLDGQVLIVGDIEDHDMPSVYGGATIFLFPSLYEGFGLPPLEAMACGVPVICSNAGSLPEVTGDAAMNVEPLDFVGLSEALRRLLSDSPLRVSLARKGLERAHRFSWQIMANEVVALYERVLE